MQKIGEDKGYQQQTPWVGIANTNQKLMLSALRKRSKLMAATKRIVNYGNDRHSIAYELHTKAVDILEGRRVDLTFDT